MPKALPYPSLLLCTPSSVGRSRHCAKNEKNKREKKKNVLGWFGLSRMCFYYQSNKELVNNPAPTESL
jgi:hypothetical protein